MQAEQIKQQELEIAQQRIALYDKKGERKFNDNGLIALALLVEETKPSDKETLVQLIAHLASKK